MITQKINVKPMSVNEAWAGRRFKTPIYKKYEAMVLLLLNKATIGTPPYKLDIEYGFSNTASDIDNPNKLLIDIMQKKYGFNDSKIYELNTRKKIVKKGQEYLHFTIQSILHPLS
jgi:Holliday junction resolvase RusA-like endonuclease